MKIIVDNQVVKMFLHDADRVMAHPVIAHPESLLSFSWPSLLEYLELGSLLSQINFFGPTQPLFQASVAALCQLDEKSGVEYLYDRLFTEMLNQVKALDVVKADFLLEKIKEKRDKLSFIEMEKVVSPAIQACEEMFTESPSLAMHDLILYLAWDRMCVCMARLFDYQSTDPQFVQNLKVLKECLVESYLHIAEQGRTNPSVYRMIEALFYFQMREENLQSHSSDEWNLLSQSFSALKNPEELMDFFYIDHAITSKENAKDRPEYYLTLDTPQAIEARFALAGYMINQLQAEYPEWNYVLLPKNIVYLDSFAS